MPSSTAVTPRKGTAERPPQEMNPYELSVRRIAREIEATAADGASVVTVTVRDVDCAPSVIPGKGNSTAWYLHCARVEHGALNAIYGRKPALDTSPSSKRRDWTSRKTAIESTLRVAGLWKEFVAAREDLKKSGVSPRDAWDRLTPQFLARVEKG